MLALRDGDGLKAEKILENPEIMNLTNLAPLVSALGEFCLAVKPGESTRKKGVAADLIRKQKIATLPELKNALCTKADITVFRRLAELSYRTSYTHRGKYYTLDTIPEYDEWGLWFYRSACFSKRGTLVDTAVALVEESEAGYFGMELDDLLTVDVKGTLLKLVRQQRLGREKVIGRYLYCSKETEQRRRQQRLPKPSLEARYLRAALRPPWYHRHGGPLPARHV